MKTYGFRYLLIGLLVGVLTACSQPPDLFAIDSLCAGVAQEHPEIDEPFRLPITDDLLDILGRMGIDLLEPGQACDATLTVQLTFTPWEAVFDGKSCYYGSRVRGTAELKTSDGATLREDLYGSEDTTGGSNIVRTCYIKSDPAIYTETEEEALLDLMINLWGPRGMMALLDWGQNWSDLSTSIRKLFLDDQLSEEKTTAALLYALEYGSREVGYKALEVLNGLTGLSGRDVDEVLGVLRNTQGIGELLLVYTAPEYPPIARAHAVSLLGRLRLEAPGAIAAAISLLEDPQNASDNAILGSVIRAINNYGIEASAAAPALEALLDHDDPYIRSEAARVLERITP